MQPPRLAVLFSPVRYLNLDIPLTVRNAIYIGEEPLNRATWLGLLTYCCEQENGGIIANCHDWGDRKWQQTCAVTLPEMQRPSALWAWVGNDLHVWGYPEKQQAEVERKRAGGLKTAAKRWGYELPSYELPSETETEEEGNSNSKSKGELRGELQAQLVAEQPENDSSAIMNIQDVEVEAPRGFPRSEKQASEVAAFVGCPPEFAVRLWTWLAGKHWMDKNGMRVGNFRRWLRGHWLNEEERRRGVQAKAEQKNGGNGGSDWTKLKKIELKEREMDKLKREHYTEEPMGGRWDTPEHRERFKTLKTETFHLRKEL